MCSQLISVRKIKIFDEIRIIVITGELILRFEMIVIKLPESLFDHTSEVIRHSSTHVDNFLSSLQEIKSVQLICRAIESNETV